MYKRFIENKKVVCFDLDGTIVNSEPLFAWAFSNVLNLANPDIELGQVYGRPGESLYDKWARIVDGNLVKNTMTIKDLTENTYQEFLKLINTNRFEPREGFWELTYKLKQEIGLQLALTTNTPKAIAQQEVARLEIENAFDFMIFGDDVKRKKPNPEIYVKTASHFKVKPQEMLVFEDSIPGTQAASKAGSSLIVVWDTQTPKNLFPSETLTYITDFFGLANTIEYTADEDLERFKKAVAEVQRHQTQK